MSFTQTLSRSVEWQRINALPRKTPRDWEAIAKDLTQLLKTPEGTMQLRPIQAQALVEMKEAKGLLGCIVVGGGKQLISLLAPYVLEAKRPLLVLPSSLVQKTINDRRKLAVHWRIPMTRIVPFDEISRVKGAHIFDGQKPDLVIADEAHRVKNKKAAVTRRFLRWFREHPETMFVGLSGTLMVRSLMDFGHLAKWALRNGSPLPLTEEELFMWANAVDEKVNPVKRVFPGPLAEWAAERTDDEIVDGRKGFYNRFSSTTGIVSTNAQIVGASLYISGLHYSVKPETEKVFERLRTLSERADGWAFAESALMRMYARQVAIGFTGVWDPWPPEEWLEARRNWARFVRETLKNYRTVDSELQVAQSVDSGQIKDTEGTLAAWRTIKATFRVQPKDIWHDDSALKVCEEWAKIPGIIWAEHIFFAEELSRRTALPYFGQGARDAKDNYLQDVANAMRDGAMPRTSVICSPKACVEGLDLQEVWSRNLMTACPTSAKDWEQILGRTHRPKHCSDEVEVEILLGCREHLESWEKAVAQALALQDTMGQPQKLCLADVTDMMKGSGQWSWSV